MHKAPIAKVAVVSLSSRASQGPEEKLWACCPPQLPAHTSLPRKMRAAELNAKTTTTMTTQIRRLGSSIETTYSSCYFFRRRRSSLFGRLDSSGLFWGPKRHCWRWRSLSVVTTRPARSARGNDKPFVLFLSWWCSCCCWRCRLNTGWLGSMLARWRL